MSYDRLTAQLKTFAKQTYNCPKGIITLNSKLKKDRETNLCPFVVPVIPLESYRYIRPLPRILRYIEYRKKLDKRTAG